MLSKSIKYSHIFTSPVISMQWIGLEVLVEGSSAQRNSSSNPSQLSPLAPFPHPSILVKRPMRWRWKLKGPTTAGIMLQLVPALLPWDTLLMISFSSSMPTATSAFLVKSLVRRRREASCRMELRSMFRLPGEKRSKKHRDLAIHPWLCYIQVLAYLTWWT